MSPLSSLPVPLTPPPPFYLPNTNTTFQAPTNSPAEVLFCLQALLSVTKTQKMSLLNIQNHDLLKNLVQRLRRTKAKEHQSEKLMWIKTSHTLHFLEKKREGGRKGEGERERKEERERGGGREEGKREQEERMRERYR